jgi:hypothetical protein
MSKCISCDKRPTFNLPNNLPLYCNDHKKPEMINVTHKKCIHNKRKQLCKECGGISLCEHNKVKFACKQCNGTSICEHNKVKSKCLDCGGSNYCVHLKQKTSCLECKGIGICIHNKRKEVCKICKGTSICIHNKEKRYCKVCGGSAICTHNKLKTQCKQCGGASLCKTPLCETIKKNPKYDGHCAFCYYHLYPDKPNARNYKTKERSVTEFILNTFPEYTWITDKKVEDGCSLRRPDLLP